MRNTTFILFALLIILLCGLVVPFYIIEGATPICEKDEDCDEKRRCFFEKGSTKGTCHTPIITQSCKINTDCDDGKYCAFQRGPGSKKGTGTCYKSL
jgi:hypothetical protein